MSWLDFLVITKKDILYALRGKVFQLSILHTSYLITTVAMDASTWMDTEGNNEKRPPNSEGMCFNHVKIPIIQERWYY